MTNEAVKASGDLLTEPALPQPGPALPWLRDLFEMEGKASQIRPYQSYLIPGIFQTEAYERPAAEAVRPALPAEKLEQSVALKMTWQEILEREDLTATAYRALGYPASGRWSR